MKVFRPMIVFLIFTMTIGCGEQKRSQTQKESNPVCSGINCHLPSTWKMVMPGRYFPRKIRLDINGVTVLDECTGKQKYTVSRAEDPQMILLDHFYLPLENMINIKIFERSETCDDMKDFLSLEDASYEIKKVDGIDVALIVL